MNFILKALCKNNFYFEQQHDQQAKYSNKQSTEATEATQSWKLFYQ